MFRAMSTWHERLKKRMDEKGLTPPRLAELSGVSLANIYKYLEGSVDSPRHPTIPKLAKALEVSEEWLLVGIDKVRGLEGMGITLVGLRTVPLLTVEMLMALERDDDPAKYWPPDGSTVTVTDDVGGRSFAVRLDDDSMLHQFRPGDVVVFDPDVPPSPGRFVIAKVLAPVRILIRRFKGTSGADPRLGVLTPENDHYPPVPLQDHKDGWIIARAVKRITDI